MDGPVDIETLLQHRGFVRALARRLVRDDARADDVVQETYVAALKNPPRHAGALRSWLATVVRKLAWTQTRGENRRVRRERDAAPPARAPEPADVLERAHWHQRLVNLVMKLDEPYRSTLLLRYFEDLNSSEIARLQGVPAATVRTRLRRGIEQLRAALDEGKGGRAAWTGALVLLAWPEAATPAAAAAPLAAPAPRWPWVAAALGVVAFLGFFLWQVAGNADAPVERTGREGVQPSARGSAGPFHLDSGRWPETPGYPLDVTVLADGRPATGARVVAMRHARPPLWRYSPRDAWRVHDRSRADEDGRAYFVGLTTGYVRVLADLAGYGRATAIAFLPQELTHAIVLELPPASPVGLAVVDDATDAPVPDARVEVLESDGAPWLPEVAVAPTDAAGRTIVPAALLRVSAAGYATATTRGPVVKLTPLSRTLVWPIASGAPRDGTPLGLRRIHDRTATIRGRVEDGAVIASGLAPGVVPELLAIAPDGRFARVFAEEPVAFERPPKLEVRAPEDAAVRLFDAASGTAVYPDGAGRVSLPVYARDPVTVRVRTMPLGVFRTVGRYDPRDGDQVLEVELEGARARTLRVTPAVPATYELYVGRTRVDEVDAADGTLRFSAPPGPVHLLAPGYLPARGENGAVDLEPAGRLVVHVALAAPEQPYHLALLDAGDEEKELRRGPWRFRLYPGPDHVVREAMVPAGRFVVRDLTSGKTTEVFASVPGETARLRIDLTDVWPPRAPEVRGVVEGFGDLDLRSAQVVAVVPGDEWFEESVPVAPDGTFRLRWSGEGALTLRARHPQAEAVPEAAVTVTRPRDDVLLRLRPRHRAFVRIAPAPGRLAAGTTAPRVRLTGRETRVLDAALGDGELRFAGFEPGTYDLWIDLPGLAPRTLRAVTLRAGTTDLGTVELSRGASLRFRLLGRDRPDLTISAQALDAPRYQRSLRTNGKEIAVLAGLGPGVFQVTAWERATGLKVWSRRVEVHGDQAFEIDLR